MARSSGASFQELTVTAREYPLAWLKIERSVVTPKGSEKRVENIFTKKEYAFEE